MLQTTYRATLVAAAVLAYGPAHAHITLETQEAAAGGYYTAVLRVSHGCEGSPTTAVRVQIPDGVMGVRPQPKPGWELEIVRESVDEAADHGHSHGVNDESAERISEIRWTDGSLPDEYYDEFRLRMLLPDSPGKVVYFPTVQECEEGVHRWIEIPEEDDDAAEFDEPAPGLTLTPAD